MRTILDWRCGYCDSIQKSDSSIRWSMDHCKCGESFVDLEEHYQRNMGEVIVINTAVFGEINQDLDKDIKKHDVESEFDKFLKMHEASEKIREGINEGTSEGINSEKKMTFADALPSILLVLLGYVIGLATFLWWLG
jgi:hypothetical protein